MQLRAADRDWPGRGRRPAAARARRARRAPRRGWRRDCSSPPRPCRSRSPRCGRADASSCAGWSAAAAGVSAARPGRAHQAQPGTGGGAGARGSRGAIVRTREPWVGPGQRAHRGDEVPVTRLLVAARERQLESEPFESAALLTERLERGLDRRRARRAGASGIGRRRSERAVTGGRSVTRPGAGAGRPRGRRARARAAGRPSERCRSGEERGHGAFHLPHRACRAPRRPRSGRAARSATGRARDVRARSDARARRRCAGVPRSRPGAPGSHARALGVTRPRRSRDLPQRGGAARARLDAARARRSGRPRQGAAHRAAQLVDRERLGEAFGDARAFEVAQRLGRAVGGHDDHRLGVARRAGACVRDRRRSCPGNRRSEITRSLRRSSARPRPPRRCGRCRS